MKPNDPHLLIFAAGLLTGLTTSYESWTTKLALLTASILILLYVRYLNKHTTGD